MRSRWLLVACTFSGAIAVAYFFGSDLFVDVHHHSLQVRRIMVAALVMAGALAGFGFYELQLWASRNDRK